MMMVVVHSRATAAEKPLALLPSSPNQRNQRFAAGASGENPFGDIGPRLQAIVRVDNRLNRQSTVLMGNPTPLLQVKCSQWRWGVLILRRVPCGKSFTTYRWLRHARFLAISLIRLQRFEVVGRMNHPIVLFRVGRM